MNPKGTFSLTPEQKQKIIGILIQGVVTMALAILAVIGYNVIVVQPQLARLAQPAGIEQAVPPAGVGVLAVPYNISALPMRCKNAGINCVEIWNGSDLSMYSDGGTTRKLWIDGALGDITASGTITVANLISTTVGFIGSTGTVTDLTTTNITGTLATAAQPNVTSLGAQTNLRVAAPTAVASATPAARINSLGANNDLLVVEKAATPVFKVGNGGVITGQVLQYGTAGQKVVCGSTVVTGTAVIATGLATPTYLTHSLAQDPTGDAATTSHTNAAATVTLKVWNTALTPAANTTPATVNWCAVGTP